MRCFAGLALACALAAPAMAASAGPPRPYTVEDMLGVLSVGRAAFSGDGRTLVFELQGPITAAGRWDLEFLSIQRTGRLYRVDVEQGGAPRRLLDSPAGVGESLGALSPDGRRLVVYRLKDHTNELGAVDLASGKVRRSGHAVDAEAWFSLARWRNNDELVVLTTTPDTPSMLLNQGWQAQARTQAAWAAAQAGRPSVIALRGGPGAERNPPWPDTDVIVFNALTGAARVVGRGRFMEVSIAPGGATAALISADEPVMMDSAFLAQNGLFDRRRRLVLADLRSGALVQACPRCDLASSLVSWSPDGRSAVFSARPDDAKSGDWRDIRYWRTSITGGAMKLSSDLAPGVTRTVGATTALLQPDAGWIDGAPAVLAHRADSPALAWWRIGANGPEAVLSDLTVEGGRRLAQAPRGFLVRTARGVVAVGGSAQTIASPNDKVVAAPVLAGDLPLAVQVETADGARAITASGQWRLSSPIPAGAVLLAQAPATGATLSLAKTDHGVGTLWLTRPGQAARALMTLNAGLADVDLAPPRAIAHRTPRGDAVTSWLYTPAGHRAGDDRALIVVPYPGSNYTSSSVLAAPDFRGYTANIRLMVGAGYAVLAPSLPIPADAPPQEGLTDAMLSAVDAALAADPGLSKTRLAVWGHSYGGYGALVAATQTPRFKAVISSSGVSDLFSYWAAQGPAATAIPEVMLRVSTMFGWAESGQGRMAGPPWAQPQRYIDGSPLLQADKITAPVLLIQGDLDYDPYKSMSMFAALYRQGKPVELLTYPGEGHVVQSPANVRDVYRRSFAFLHAALSEDRPTGSTAEAVAGGATPTPPARPSQ